MPRPEAAALLLWWRPTAATFVVAMNRVDVVDLDVDLVDVDLDVDLVDVDLVDVDVADARPNFCFELLKIQSRVLMLQIDSTEHIK